MPTMISSTHVPPSAIHQNRQQMLQERRHKRQQSTPNANFDTIKIQPPHQPMAAPPSASLHHHRQSMSHRRGLSLDTRRQVLSNRQNVAIAATSASFMGAAHPTSSPIAAHHQHFASMTAEHENYLLSPHTTPHSQRFDAGAYDASLQFDNFGPDMGLHSAPIVSKDFDFFTTESPLTTSSFVYAESPTAAGWMSENEPQGQPPASVQRDHSRRHSRRISNGIIERVNKFENMGMEAPVQQGQSVQGVSPSTPTEQDMVSHSQSGYMPPTPMETPQEHSEQNQQLQNHMPAQGASAQSDGQTSQASGQMPSRFEEGYDDSMEETVKPIRKQTSRGLSTFDEMRQQAEQQQHQSQNMMSVPNTPIKRMPYVDPSAMPQPPSAGYMNMTNVSNEFIKLQNQYVGMVTPEMAQYQQQVMMTGMMPPGMPGMMYHPKPLGMPEPLVGPDNSLIGLRPSAHRRTESMASIASAASIASINIEETKTETGVTMDDIAQYIQGPEADNKYSCLFEGCGKRFGRKENIKSHVQTHLNDRQYQCPTCQKCFVRQHDLKRHAKIHTGIKPYPCECGNSFARHDALTRHRQRGMCIGAFDGIVRKVVKRGRPRKKRPEMEERQEKSARTRRKNNLSISSTSSFSSESSGPESPGQNEFEIENTSFDLMDVALSVDCVIPGVGVPMPVSTGVSSQNLVAMPEGIPITSEFSEAPTVNASPNNYVSPDAVLDSVVPHSSPGVKDEFNTPPELSKSVSPTPGNNSGNGSQLFDSNIASAPIATTSIMEDSLLAISGLDASGTGSTSGMSGNGTMSEDDMLLNGFNSDGLVLDRDPIMMHKFDEEFETVSMFPPTDDMFSFGNV